MKAEMKVSRSHSLQNFLPAPSWICLLLFARGIHLVMGFGNSCIYQYVQTDLQANANTELRDSRHRMRQVWTWESLGKACFLFPPWLLGD